MARARRDLALRRPVTPLKFESALRFRRARRLGSAMSDPLGTVSVGGDEDDRADPFRLPSIASRCRMGDLSGPFREAPASQPFGREHEETRTRRIGNRHFPFVLPSQANAQADESAESKAPQNTITGNPLGLIFGNYALEFERVVSKSGSFYVTPAVTGASVSGAGIWGVGIDAGYRHFFTGEAPSGFWAGPTAGLAFVTGTGALSGVGGVGAGIGGMLGYTWILGKAFVISIGGGGSLVFGGAAVSVGNEVAEASLVRVAPALRLSFGGAF